MSAKNPAYTGVEEVPILEMTAQTIALMMPHRPKGLISGFEAVVASRWIGQGPRVQEFENQFARQVLEDGATPLAVGSGTDALHLAYLLAGIGPGDEVIVPVFTCTATNIPLLYIGAKLVFADVEASSLNISVEHVKTLISEKTRAIVAVDYGGNPSDILGLRELVAGTDIKIIQDAAQSLGGKIGGRPVGTIADYTTFSFQAVKHITTGDGGMLCMLGEGQKDLAGRLRWFGIDRDAKQKGIWENDIAEVGFKYQMTDIAASMGIAGLSELDQILQHRRSLVSVYCEELRGLSAVTVLGVDEENIDNHAAWLMTISVKNRRGLQEKLLANGIESNQVHYRNDKYSIFGGARQNLPNMNAIESDYLCLPLHTSLNENHVRQVCSVIRSGW